MAYDGALAIQALHAAYSSGSLTPSSLVSALHTKIIEYSTSNPHVWIDIQTPEKLQLRAQELEKTYEGKEKPPLYGIPFSLKNNIDVEGFKTTAGCEKFAYYPEETAEVVRRCLKAGAILMGTTNLEQFATGLTGCRSPYGTPLCHQDSSFCAGGSSSGSAVSVAAQLVTFSIGTDTAGSIRVPAALNEVVGYKPTFGRVSKRGVVPAVKTLDCVGVLSKCVEDARRVWEVIKGYDELDAYSRKDQLFDRIARWERSQNLRVGVPPSHLLEKLSEEYRKCWIDVSSTLSEKGFPTSKTFGYDPFEEANELVYGSSLVAQRLASFEPFLQKHGTVSLHPAIRSIFENTPTYTAIDAFRDLNRVVELKRQVEAEFRNNIDVLIVPSTAKHWRIREVEADPQGTNQVLGTFSQFVNLLDLCAISIPVGTWLNEERSRMSFGITLIAEAGRDEDLLELAQRFF
ncbi:hypothetical protein JCM3765_006268 [Sporobolomyces pararoseus]